ncbi:HopJ type III effector protein [Thiomicrorhabdus sp. 6S3-12]|uniref:HopJ type III effector protein n=1 Tax=Thiomicrorhabdus sp. 6S3-12 TaxID=2819681 RepID=UPI001AADEB4D|nr:HopJ type III effector protein [Thiomicrorhabdus sp. 6S3-12]MBO1925153.1 HopJ type III effector protein [Thiomicrorhabdus sp. 6S3-12]
MTINGLISAAKNAPVEFSRTMQVIDDNYIFVPTEFKNGQTTNAADTNNGSCKLFAFAQLNDLDEQTTLNLFGDFYTKDVLQNPQGDDHQNIRNFMQYGWAGIEFASQPLSVK